MKLKRLLTEDRAVSPVIGVILMVAITVILAAVIGTFVLGLGENVQTTPQAKFTFDFANDDPDTLTITHDGGDELDGSTVNLAVNGVPSGNGTYTGSAFGSTVSAGTTYELTESDFDGSGLNLSGATVRVVWTNPDSGDSATLGTWTGPDA